MAGTGLVGREDVLAQLGRVVEEAAKGRGGLVLLTGEGGIGKSAVVAAAAGAAAGQGARVA
jgi:predicted ATPase